MELPIEIYQEILARSGFLCQIRLTQLNKYYNKNLKIYDFLNIDYKYRRLLSDNVLKKYKYIKKLCTSGSGENITNVGISHMNLHTLNASYNSKITDEGISHMKLHTLYSYNNPSITDNGIKH